LTAVTQPPDAFGQRRVAGDDGARITHRTEVLRRIEAERARDAKRADRAATTGGEVSLTTVLHQRKIVPRGQRLQPIEVGGLSVQVHRNYGCGS
jgi:hypothetical protein